MIETTTTSPITLSSIIHISLTFDKLLNSWLQLQRRNPSCLWGLFPFQRCPAPSELTDSDFRKEIVRCFFREIMGRWNKLPCNGSFSKCEWAGHGATDNLHRLETSTSVSSFGFLGLPSASFAAFPLKFVCKRLCGLHCRPQAKARGKKTDSFHLFKCDLGQTSLPHRREAQRSILYSAFSPQGLSWGLPLAKPAQWPGPFWQKQECYSSGPSCHLDRAARSTEQELGNLLQALLPRLPPSLKTSFIYPNSNFCFYFYFEMQGKFKEHYSHYK